MLYLCSTHFLKNIIDDIDRLLLKHDPKKSKTIKKAFVITFTILQNSLNIEEFCEALKSMKIIFTSYSVNDELLKHQKIIQDKSKTRNIDFLKDITVEKETEAIEENEKNFFIENKKVNFVKDSPFTFFLMNF